MIDRNVLEHKLLKPVTLITGYIGILEAGLKGSLNDKQKETVSKIKEQLQKLTINIRDHVDQIAKI